MFNLGNAYKNQLLENSTENKYYSASMKIDMSDNNNTKVIITNWIKKNSICLDVGCGAGYLGELLHDNKKAKMYGIDVDEAALEYAKVKNCFTDLYHFSITDPKGKDYQKFLSAKIKFDYVIFADVLEHVVSADELLVFFSKFLKPNGKIIISLPNIAHFDIVRGLMNGKFNYNHIGLLDNTHLRFYTRSSFEEFIQQINVVYKKEYVLKEIGRTIAEPDYLDNYDNLYKLLNKNGSACVLQYVYELSVEGENGRSGEAVKERCTFDELEQLLVEGRRKNTEVKELNKRIVELENAIDEIYRSRSWRITKPIRSISSILKKKG